MRCPACRVIISDTRSAVDYHNKRYHPKRYVAVAPALPPPLDEAALFRIEGAANGYFEKLNRKKRRFTIPGL